MCRERSDPAGEEALRGVHVGEYQHSQLPIEGSGKAQGSSLGGSLDIVQRDREGRGLVVQVIWEPSTRQEKEAPGSSGNKKCTWPRNNRGGEGAPDGGGPVVPWDSASRELPGGGGKKKVLPVENGRDGARNNKEGQSAGFVRRSGREAVKKKRGDMQTRMDDKALREIRPEKIRPEGETHLD